MVNIITQGGCEGCLRWTLQKGPVAGSASRPVREDWTLREALGCPHWGKENRSPALLLSVDTRASQLAASVICIEAVAGLSYGQMNK